MGQDTPRPHPPADRDPPERGEPDDPGTRWSDGLWARVALSALVLAVAVGFLGSRYLTPDCEREGCPSVERLRSYRPPEPPRIHDADGDLAGQLSGPRRIVVPLDSMSELLRDGYVAVEDQRFYEHGGVDLKGAFRALLTNIRAGGIAEGASTIPMQLARNVFEPEVWGWHKLHRKLAEIRLAREIEDQLDKDEILEIYLNQIYLGDGVYGVETAARHYFGKSASEVGTREAALLVGLAKNPEGYNPRRHPGAAAERTRTVLDVLARQGVISAEEAARAAEARLELAPGSTAKEWGDNAYYLSAVRRELRELFPDPRDRQGLRVYTGLDPRAQAAGVRALRRQIEAIEAGRWGAFRHERAGGSLPRTDAAHSPYLQGMVIAMDPATGLVSTLVGGRDYEHSEFDRAFQALRQAGSAFKPIVYAAALESGLRLTDRISTQPVRLARQGMEDWQPGDHVRGGELSVREALVYSSNTAAVRVGQRLGTRAVADQALEMGLSGDIPHYPAIYLGAADVVPAELVAAYATFTNGGHTIEPHLITRVEDHEGLVVYSHDPAGRHRVLDSRIAFLVLDMLRDVVRRGTGWRVGASGLSYPAAGKTGTTNESRDAWFVGMTPRLAAGVWIGFDEPRTIVPGAGGGDLAAPAWASFMQVANGSLGPMPQWKPPPGVVEARIDARSGYRVPEDCPVADARTEYFLMGTEPFEYCPYPVNPWLWRDEDGRWRYGDRYGDRYGAAYGDRYDDRGDSDDRRQGRTVFYRGGSDDDRRRDRMERLDRLRERLASERQRRLDSLRAVGRARAGDTIRPDTVRPDTARPDTTRPDTTRPDTVGTDTVDASGLRTRVRIRPSPPPSGR